jgi:nucleoside-diphosphate-sugar epimerase
MMKVLLLRSSAIIITLFVAPMSTLAMAAPKPMRVTVFGGTGYVGSKVCERLVQRGHEVTAVSRRGVNPKPDSKELSQVKWISGDATNIKTVESLLKDSDAAVHAIGLLFDVESGLANLNKIVSGSGSIPGDASTYDAITRTTAFNVIESIEKKQSSIANMMNKEKKFPLCFVSAAEAGWPDVQFGNTIDSLAPGWLKKYLIAKRAVEKRLKDSNETKGVIRSAIYRPSLIWDWSKLDVLPVIPVFNIASAIGVPFVDKTVRIETLADAIVAGIENDDIEGVQRVGEMEKICQRVR